MTDEGNEEGKPKFRVIQGGRTDPEDRTAEPYEAMVGRELDGIKKAAKLKASHDDPSSFEGDYRGSRLIVERRFSPGSRRTNFSYFHPEGDPSTYMEGFTIIDSRGISIDEKFLHIQILKGPDGDVSERSSGLEAKAKIDATLRNAKRLLGIAPSPQA